MHEEDGLPTDDFCESISQSTYECGQHDGSHAVVDTWDEKPQRDCSRFVVLVVLFSL